MAYKSGIAPFNFNLKTSPSSGPLALLTTDVRGPSFSLILSDFSIGSLNVFFGVKSTPDASPIILNLRTFNLASSEIGIGSPCCFSVQKYLPDLEFLSGTTWAMAPAFILLFKEDSIGSYYL